MFIIDLTYKVPLEQVDKFLHEHIEFLNEQYDQNNFIASGRKVPRTGGIILARITDRKEVENIIEKDPFRINNVADYAITEFIPGKTSEELKFLMDE